MKKEKGLISFMFNAMMIMALFIVMVLLINYLSELPTKSDYCHNVHGGDYFLDYQRDMPSEIYSCDTINENGEIIMKYFTVNKFKAWAAEQE